MKGLIYPYTCKDGMSWLKIVLAIRHKRYYLRFLFTTGDIELCVCVCVCLFVDGSCSRTLGKAICFAQATNWNVLSSGSTSQLYLEMSLNAISRCPMTQSSSHVKLTITGTLSHIPARPDDQLSSTLWFCFGFNWFFSDHKSKLC